MCLTLLKTAHELLFTLSKYLIDFHSHQIFKLIFNFSNRYHFNYFTDFKINFFHHSNLIDFEICPKVFINLF